VGATQHPPDVASKVTSSAGAARKGSQMCPSYLMGQQTAGTSAASERQVATSKIREKGQNYMPCNRAVYRREQDRNSCSSLDSRPLFGLLYKGLDDDECGVVSRIRIGRGNGNTRKEPAPVPLRQPQIPHDLKHDRNRATAVGNR
jgi:hypothetical protein